MAEARLNLSELIYAKSTAYMCRLPRRETSNLSLTEEALMEVAAVLRAADFSSGVQFLAEAKQLHVRAAVGSGLEVCFQDDRLRIRY